MLQWAVVLEHSFQAVVLDHMEQEISADHVGDMARDVQECWKILCYWKFQCRRAGYSLSARCK